MRCASFLYLCMILSAATLWAAQTGTIRGTVDADGKPLSGVVVTASSDISPVDRHSVTNGFGEFRFLNLLPGVYTFTFERNPYYPTKRQVRIFLDSEVDLQVTLTNNPQIQESLLVMSEPLIVNNNSAELRDAFSRKNFEQIPVGETYRDLLKLMPAVANVPYSVRGPNSGGSGQDNRYAFDGVDVTLPLFGTLTSEPTLQDIEQFSVMRGGAKATGFNRSGGFIINSISRSGTNKFTGNLTLRAEPASWRASNRQGQDPLAGEQESLWANASAGGPLTKDRLYYYVSVFAPSSEIQNRSNNFGDLPDAKSERQEIFAKLTYTPSQSLTIHGSYRDSHREVEAESLFELSAPTVGTTTETDQTISIWEANWFISEQQTLSMRFNDYKILNRSRPLRQLETSANPTIDGAFDIDRLDQMGYLLVPNFRDANDGVDDQQDQIWNATIRPFVERYGFTDRDGNLRGGNAVGAWYQFNRQDYKRQGWEITYDSVAAFGNTTHNLHVGFQHIRSNETLQRQNNGWGIITFENTDRLLRAEYLRNSGSDPIFSEIISANIEVNDTINWNHCTINLGFVLSHDAYYGEGLATDDMALSGFVEAPGNRYKMYEIDWEDMIQPRLSMTYELPQANALAASYARYYPMASSLPRAASWARNQALLRTRTYFDQNGTPLFSEDLGASSGKLFQPDMDPRYIDEWGLMYTHAFGNTSALQVNYRHRYSQNFWEDTLNDARLFFGASSQDPNFPVDELINSDPYIPELAAYLEQIGSGSSFVIAELDGAFTKYHELTFDWEQRLEKLFLKATYTWSQYYGNFDQDNTTSNNDTNVFLGSSNLADSYGRQIWDLKYGSLKGDRRHLLKLFGNYQLPWQASIGAFAIYQDGAPWETWDRDHYVQFGYDYSFSNTIRFAEPAGSRREPDHYQIDLRYIQTFYLGSIFELDLQLDAFNVFNHQTGYDIDPVQDSPTYGQPNNFWPGRVLRLGASLTF